MATHYELGGVQTTNDLEMPKTTGQEAVVNAWMVQQLARDIGEPDLVARYAGPGNFYSFHAPGSVIGATVVPSLVESSNHIGPTEAAA